MYERRDIWRLSGQDPWHSVIEWYARGIAELQARDGSDYSDPTCWHYLASIHGTDAPRSSWPAGATWDECEHNTWYFLPWHRIYLHYFEQVVRSAVRELGGPEDWALPYWDYSDPGREEVRTLPPAFRQQTTPWGKPNPLFVKERAAGMNASGRIPSPAVETGTAMKEPTFTGPTIGRIAGFGGPVTGRNHGGGSVGSLENVPHGTVHMAVGGINPRGYMSRFETAGLDPLFWLHHANVDRLWQVWLEQAGRANPAQSAWTGMKFTIGSGAPAVTLAVRDVLDTTAAPLSYHYERLAVPAPEEEALFPAMTKAAFDLEVTVSDDSIPETVGASERPVPLTATRSHVDVFVAGPSGPVLESMKASAASLPPRVYLRVEDVNGSELAAPAYLVYVNVPDGSDPESYPERRAGQISMFGVLEASQPDSHGAGGLTFDFDITPVAHELQAAGAWDPERLHVTFAPVQAEDEPLLEKAAAGPDGNVTAGRVSVIYA